MSETVKKKSKYSQIRFYRPLTVKIEELIASDKHGYTNIHDFVKASVRKYLRELGYIE